MKRQIENEGEYLHPKQLALNLSHAKTIEVRWILPKPPMKTKSCKTNVFTIMPWPSFEYRVKGQVTQR